MKVKVLELTERKGRLVVEEATPDFVNSLRRAILAEVPKLAINNVVFYDNNSALFDEMISHRLGLLPVPTDLGLMNFRDACVCDAQGCPSCTVRYTLSKEGPATVLSGDLQPEDPKWALSDPGIPIVELAKEHRLILEAEAVLGRGSEHAKWQAASGVGYSYFVTLKGGPKAEQTTRDVVKTCPLDGPKVKGGAYDVVDESGSATLCDACLQGLEDAGIPASYDGSRFVFTFETDGALSARKAMEKAVDILKGRVASLLELSSDLKATPETVAAGA